MGGHNIVLKDIISALLYSQTSLVPSYKKALNRFFVGKMLIFNLLSKIVTVLKKF